MDYCNKKIKKKKRKNEVYSEKGVEMILSKKEKGPENQNILCKKGKDNFYRKRQEREREKERIYD
jgi:hypothetical protein